MKPLNIDWSVVYDHWVKIRLERVKKELADAKNYDRLWRYQVVPVKEKGDG